MMFYVLLAIVVMAAVVLGIELFRKRQDILGGASSAEIEQSRQQNRQHIDEQRRREERFRQEQKDREIKQLEGCVRSVIGSGDPHLIGLLENNNGDGAGSGLKITKEVLGDADAVRRIARTIEAQTLRVLAVASQNVQQFDLLDLESTETRERVRHPADETELERLRSDNYADVILEELGLTDDQFYALMVDDQLHEFANYEIVHDKRRAYILIDVSQSVSAKMADGATRVQWQAGIALKLLQKAKEGKAEYTVRYFGSEPYGVRVVRNELDAEFMTYQLLQLTDRGSGTDIMAALEQAYQDVTASDDEDVRASDIILLTDGASSLNTTRLDEMFGEGSRVRLHVALIGLENPTLKQFASSYKVYR